jgi:hypothetical protein
VALPKDKDVSLFCGLRSAFAVMEEEDRTSLLPLLGDASAPVTMVREHDFGEDEQRELSEYSVGSDVGVVRLGVSGALAFRELTNNGLGSLHKLRTSIGRDDDVVAVDASGRSVVVVSTQEANEQDAGGETATATSACTKVNALRVDRQTLDEDKVELAPSKCGHEVGPFFTGLVGEAVAVAWPERTGGAGRPRAPIVGLVHARVDATGKPATGRIEQSADAIVDAGCDGTRCYAVALAAGMVKVLRYP